MDQILRACSQGSAHRRGKQQRERIPPDSPAERRRLPLPVLTIDNGASKAFDIAKP
jgi:hypothetical protein